MLPDYPHKIFNDKRINYSLLMETLAMDASSLKGELIKNDFFLIPALYFMASAVASQSHHRSVLY